MSEGERVGSYRIECLACGAVAYGDPDSDVEHDREYHRDRCSGDAEFDVAYDTERGRQ